MAKQITEKGKIRQKRGTGAGKDYISWIKARDFGSSGTCSVFCDWKTGRQIQTLSQGEMHLYHMLRWKDEVQEIREQYPLPTDETVKIADTLGLLSSHPRDVSTGYKTPAHMTTDLLAILKNGKKEAYSVKYSKKSFESKKTVARAYIEKRYWESKGVPFYIRLTENMNIIYARNIEAVVKYYDLPEGCTCDDITLLKHRIAVKEIEVDMENSPLNFTEILKKEKREFHGTDKLSIEYLWQDNIIRR